MGVLAVLLCIFCTTCLVTPEQFLWFENEPDMDDPCTMVKIGGKRGDMTCEHLPITCRDHGAFVHFANYDKTWLHLFIDHDRHQEFELCLTGGTAERSHIWYDYARRNWQPMAHDAWFGMAARKDACKKSINGSLNLFFEAPWWFVNYVAYVTWNITEIEDYQPKPWPPEGAQDNPYKHIDAEIFAPDHVKRKNKKDESSKKDKDNGKEKKKKRKKKKKKKDNDETEKTEQS